MGTLFAQVDIWQETFAPSIERSGAAAVFAR